MTHKSHQKQAIRTWQLLVGVLALFSSGVFADPLIMRRMDANFPDTMVALQTSITEQGYAISRVQRVDIGLTKTGHETDRYRLVFFGKGPEIRSLLNKYPQLAPYLPLKIVIYAEADDTIVLTNNMENMKQLYPDENLARVFDTWNQDIVEILEATRQRTEN
ncbi:MAG: DUF302 domain-containing protein [Gammaproteobacteria bacterium]|nr:DUF302 domain-containing protein [Gammaproteobacteria bacterium]